MQEWQSAETAPKDGRRILGAAYIVPSAEATRNGATPFWDVQTTRFIAGTWAQILGGKIDYWLPIPALATVEQKD
jgi:hypothetical protein